MQVQLLRSVCAVRLNPINAQVGHVCDFFMGLLLGRSLGGPACPRRKYGNAIVAAP